MEVFRAIKERRSIRRFSEKPVQEGKLRKILEAGRFAPSGLNNQPWRFIIIKDPAVREKLSSQTIYGDSVRQAPASIAVFLDADSSYDERKDTQAIGACIQNMLLEVHSLGLGACWIGDILKNKEKVASILSAPETFELMAVIVLGYSAEDRVEKPERKNVSELVYKKWD